MTAVQQAIVLFIFEGGRKVEKVQCPGKAFDRIVKIGCGFRILTDYQVVHLAGHFLLKNGTDKKGGRTSLKIFAGYALGGRQ